MNETAAHMALVALTADRQKLKDELRAEREAHERTREELWRLVRQIQQLEKTGRL